MNGNDARHVKRSKRFLSRDITAEATVFPGGIRVSVYGGDHPGLGAVSVVSPEGRITTTQFSGRCDGEITQQWAEALCGGGLLPAVVDAGVHYDDLSPAGIGEMLRQSQALLDALVEDIMNEQGNEDDTDRERRARCCAGAYGR